MSPEARKRIPEQVIKTEIGKLFRPFKGLVNLPPPDEGKELIESVYAVASAEFELKGIKMSLLLMPVRAFEISHGDGFDTPLGAVSREAIYKNNRYSETKVPLTIGLFSEVDLVQFTELTHYRLAIRVENKTYYLLCPEDITPSEIDESWQDHVSEKHPCTNDKPTDKRGKPIQVLLPYDPKKLSTIGVTIIRKD